MSELTVKNPWVRYSVGLVLVAVLLSALIGFIWVPMSNNPSIGAVWDAICSAAGVPGGSRARNLGQDGVARPSDVIVSANMMRPANAESIGRGATLAMRCTMCHGIRGVSEANSPNLAGQIEAAIYKQLRDYQSGHRVSAIMRPMVVNLSDQDMRDLAAYYAYLPHERAPHEVADEMPRLVSNGAPMRNIGACITCHGGAAQQAATPVLEGEPEIYIRDQLHAFRNGTRSNDLNQQMRNVARQLSDAEIEQLAAYYARR
ncbi:c-type cytochrome [Duganella sp. FT80W]|uniref:C-type cytochrome n=1 Tax=Duganella guangzhouensis TaxID=2666084 RepID=A0A6I2KSV4_9BURK|nr:c-type cytochrome [Duganella guangzhouensis]MRW88611.1 c-type cytochrome [Duganella guangzhouensis]